MAISNVAMFPQVLNTWAVQILPADTTTKKTLMTAGANGSIIESMNVSMNDVANSIFLYLNDGTTDHLMAVIPIPASAGASSTPIPSVDILRGGVCPGLVMDANGNPVIYVKAGWSVKIAANATITAAKILDCVAMGADY